MSDLRLSKTITIGTREITVKEIRPSDARKVFAEGQDLAGMDFDALAAAFLPMVCDGITPEEIEDIGLTAGLTLFDTFREVNPGFFELARRSGLMEKIDRFMEMTRQSLSQAWTEASAALSDAATVTLPDTDGPSS